MSTTEIPDLKYCGNSIDTSPAHFGTLRVSSEALGDREELWQRMTEEGYLYLPGLLDRDEVLKARKAVLQRLAEAGVLNERYPVLEGVVKPDHQVSFMPALARDNPALDKVLYSGPMIEFYEFFLGAPVRHFDYTWFRAKTPGTTTATQPHCDIVYMGRGTRQLYTSCTPIGNAPYQRGGLKLLENSHRLEALVQGYGQTDVDRYCKDEGEAQQLVEQARAENRELSQEENRQIRWNSTGSYAADALEVQRQLGGRWLTTEYEVGDLLIFCMYIMHASSDNQTDQIRLSSDSRYQLASEAVDERWIGEDPPLHGIRAKRGMIC